MLILLVFMAINCSSIEDLGYEFSLFASNQESIESKVEQILSASHITITQDQRDLIRTGLEMRERALNKKFELDYCIRDLSACPLDHYSAYGNCVKRKTASDKEPTYPCSHSRCKDGSFPSFQESCPDKWVYVRENCVPPDSYQGPCTGMFSLGLKSSEDKQLFSIYCQVKWPCDHRKSECLQCPTEWIVDEFTGICKPNVIHGDLESQEHREIDASVCIGFSADLPRTERDRISRQCNFVFECINTCVYNISTCPNGWVYVRDDVCINPQDSNLESCPRVYNPSTGSESLARELMQDCKMSFPCVYPETNKRDTHRKSGPSHKYFMHRREFALE